jgi:hypothetical protein
VEQHLTAALIQNDVEHTHGPIKGGVNYILDSLCMSFDRLIDTRVEHPTEEKAREAVMKVLSELEEMHKQALRKLEEIMAKYGEEA